MKRILSLILALLLIALPLAACSAEPEEEGYFTRTKRDSRGRLSVSLARTDKDGAPLSEKELDKIYGEACDAFSAAYDFLSTDAGSGISAINAPVSTVLDIDSTLISEIEYAFSLSESLDGLYEPCGGALTALLEKSDSPKEEELSEALSHIGSAHFELSETSVNKDDSLAKVDLGALCDGYALAAACEHLKKSVCAYGTVTFNGIAGVFGKKPEGEPFSVEIGNGEDGIFNITDGYVALVSKDFGTSYDFSDGILDTDVSHIAVYSADARSAAVIASVGYAYGKDKILSLYEKEGISFEAVILEKDGKETLTKKAKSGTLYTPITTAEDEA